MSGCQSTTYLAGELEEGDLVLTLGHTELLDGAAIRVVQRESQTQEVAP